MLHFACEQLVQLNLFRLNSHVQKSLMTLILGELAAESKARWFGLGGVTAGASATCSNLVSFLSF